MANKNAVLNPDAVNSFSSMQQLRVLNNIQISASLTEWNGWATRSHQVRWTVIKFPEREIVAEGGGAWLDDCSSLISNNYQWLLLIKLQNLVVRDLSFHAAANTGLPTEKNKDPWLPPQNY